MKKLDEFKKELEEIGDYHPDERGDVLNDFVPLLINALEEVLALHKERALTLYNAYENSKINIFICTGCSDDSAIVHYPCPTIDIIRTALGEDK